MLSHIHTDTLHKAEFEAFSWLINAYTNHGGGGFPHSRWSFLPKELAWKKDYAETTGYIIENGVSFNNFPELNTAKICLQAADWLCSIQHAEGYYHQGIQGSKSSFFNTAQILFGLESAYIASQNEKFKTSFEKSYHWLVSAAYDSNALQSSLYVKNYFGPYYSRAIWPIIKIDQKYFNSKAENIFEQKLLDIFLLIKTNGIFRFAGFTPQSKALSHTLAYTLEGLWESSLLLNNPILEEELLKWLKLLANKIVEDRNIFAEYDWKGVANRNYICVTGAAQFSALYAKLYGKYQSEIFKNCSVILFTNLLRWQITSTSIEHNGAFPSSFPIWQKYFPFQYTNWTSKFFLDACFYIRNFIV